MGARLIGGELVAGARCIRTFDDEGVDAVLVVEPLDTWLLLHDDHGRTVRISMAALPLLRRVLREIERG